MSSPLSAKKIVPVILCGGSGTRLWPLSREQMPKQFLNLVNDRSLLQNTVSRAMACSGTTPDHVVTVTLGALEGAVAAQLSALSPEAARHILCEPMARNTGAAVAMAALYVQDVFGPDSILWVLPADHHIADEPALARSLAQAVLAAERDFLTTFGIRPTRPDTGYGYIGTGPSIDAGLPDVLQASEFIEKPVLAKAESLLAAGTFLWNSGMFVFRAETVVRAFHRYALDILSGLQPMVADLAIRRTVRPDVYLKLPELPFDKAIMEKSDRVAVVPCQIGWSDIGSWESLWEISPQDDQGNVLIGDVLATGSRNVLVRGGAGRLIACVGLENVIVVDAGDAILVMDRGAGDSLKSAVAQMKAAGRAEVRDPAPVKNGASSRLQGVIE